MISLEPRASEWAVIQNGKLVSLHPTRADAERAALWLRQADPPENNLHDDDTAA